MPPVSTYPVKLGRLKLPAIIAPKDTLGDGLEAVGAVLVAAERRPRPLELELHLYGDARELDPKAVGDRLRRQITGLLENPRARIEGLWLTFEADPMLDSLLQIGGGELAIDDPSLVLGDYQLELSDVYRVAKAQTHREARRVDLRDLRLATTPRDAKRIRYGTSFSTFTKAPAAIALPSSITDPALGNDTVPSAGARPSLHGPDVPLVRADNIVNGSVVSFERAASSRGPSDVIAWDRRGILPSGAPSVAGAGGSAPAGVVVPAYSAAGDRDPAGLYGWEELYGPAHPLYNVTDPPVLENGVVRCRYLATGSAGFGGILVEAFSGGAGGYVPVSLIQPLRAPAGGPLGTIISSSLVEWTPDRAVVRISVRGSTVAGASSRAELYVTLERGWTGPQIELYLSVGPLGTAPAAAMLQANAVTKQSASANHPLGEGSLVAVPRGSITQQGVATDDVPNFATRPLGLGLLNDAEPWLYFTPTGAPGGAFGLAIAPLEPFSAISATSGVYGFVGGPTGFWDAVLLTGLVPASVNAYIGARFGVAPRGALLEAETYRVAGTTAQAADANASSGQTVSDSQAAATNSTVSLSAAQVTALNLPAGIYRFLARVRADVGATVTVVGPDGTARAVAGAATYTWVDVGDVRLGVDTLAAKAYRSAGAAGLSYVDRLALVPAELYASGADPLGAQTGQRNGGRELAAETLRPNRPTPTIVSR